MEFLIITVLLLMSKTRTGGQWGRRGNYSSGAIIRGNTVYIFMLALFAPLVTNIQISLLHNLYLSWCHPKHLASLKSKELG